MTKPSLILAISLALSLAACGGGSSGGGSLPSTGSTPTPVITPTPTPTPSATPSPVQGTDAPPLTGSPTYANGGWTPYGVASALDYPVQHGWNGSGQNVAIVIDSDVDRTVIQNYLSQFGIPMPKITTVPIDKASGIATNGEQVEAYLDVETIAGLAPGAHIYIYQVPDIGNDQQLADAYSQIDSDGYIHVVNNSFGGCEYANPEDPFINQGAQAGITFVASAGDNGNVCDTTSSPMTVGPDWPASNPNVVGAGGTETHRPSYPLTSTIVWNDDTCSSGSTGSQCAGGGGVSGMYGLPSYQVGLAGAISTTHRNVPDISLPAEDAAFNDGSWGLVNGTSWSSPEYAALMAEVLEYCHLSSGIANPVNVPYYVASHYPKTYIDVTSGNDEFAGRTPYYTAGPGYDNASGLGVPYGMTFANTVCPGGTKASALVARTAMVAPAPQALPANTPLDVRPRVYDVIDRGQRSAVAMTPIHIVLRSEADRSAVERALEQAGFTIDRSVQYRQIVHAVAPSATVEQTFHTQMHDVLQPRHGIGYMPVTQIVVPQSIASHVITVTLHNVATRHVLNARPQPLPF